MVGAGTIGQLAARVLALRGHSVTVIDQSRDRLAMNGGGVSTASTLDDIERFDWLVEATGDQNVLSSLLRQVGHRGNAAADGLALLESTFQFRIAWCRSTDRSLGR